MFKLFHHKDGTTITGEVASVKIDLTKMSLRA